MTTRLSVQKCTANLAALVLFLLTAPETTADSLSKSATASTFICVIKTEGVRIANLQDVRFNSTELFPQVMTPCIYATSSDFTVEVLSQNGDGINLRLGSNESPSDFIPYHLEWTPSFIASIKAHHSSCTKGAANSMTFTPHSDGDEKLSTDPSRSFTDTLTLMFAPN